MGSLDGVLVIGLGGIGSCLVPHLARLMAYSEKLPKRLTLIDGDSFQESNASRQDFRKDGLLMNKAVAWAGRIAKEFPQLELSSVAEYLTPSNARGLVKDGSILMLCVDNHASRLLAQERASQLRDVWLISGGNDYTDGNVQVFVKRSGRILAPSISIFHPEISVPRDRRPDEVGCDEEVFSMPQLLTANLMAASLMLNALYALSEDKLDHNEVYFDTIKNAARPSGRAISHKAK